MALGFGFNKAKVLASAEKFVQQGKLQNAIAEYEKVIKEDPKDLTVLNTIGDLYARVGQNDQAAYYFRNVGDQYAQNGFTVKAIAIYKKLTKITPHSVDNTTKLAELYTQQGLFNDARAQYMLLADHSLKAGDNAQAARIFQKILELDPENAHTQAKLADLYMKLGKKEEARTIYYSAAESLYSRGAYDAAEEALSKVITLDPGNQQALLLRGMIASDSGDTLSAVQYLEQVRDLDKHVEGLKALFRAKLQGGDAPSTEVLAGKMLTLHKDISGVTNLAQWYAGNNRVTNALRLYEKFAEQLNKSGPSALKDALHPLMSRIKDDPEALGIMERLLQQTGDPSQAAEIMELQAHASAKKGDYAAARDLYKKLSEMEPENALHGQNFRQMQAKLGEDSATRILTPEEAAQAFMVEELDHDSPVVQQHYDPPVESAIEAALTDAELFVSYNVPMKAIPPLEAVLPMAPRDITVNQRLATLYARAERYGDAARVCQVLSDVYMELGHAKESGRYLEAARKYSLRAPAATIPAGTPGPVRVAPPPPPQRSAPTLPSNDPHLERFSPLEPVSTAPPPSPAIVRDQPSDASVQEFSFDAHDELLVANQSLAAETMREQSPQHFEPPPPPPPPAEIKLQPVELPPIEVEHAHAPETDGSDEWESMLSVESDSGPAAPEMEVMPARGEIELTERGTGLRSDDSYYAIEDKIREIEFFISQEMWEPAKTAILNMAEMAPDAPQITELMARVSAGRNRAAAMGTPSPLAAAPALAPIDAVIPEPAEEVYEVEIVPDTSLEQVQLEQVELEDTAVLELPEEIVHPPKAPVLQMPPPAAAAASTEDILSDFVHDLEKSELSDFVPVPRVEVPPPTPISRPAPVQNGGAAVAQTFSGSAAKSTARRGDMQDAESANVLNDILNELQEETAGAPEPEEDPETHYNLGIAFKEMGLLDEAIGELQKVCHAIDRGHNFSQPVQAYTWLAQCLVDKGAPEAAVRWYQKALQLPGMDDGSRCSIYYDLASAFEASGDKKSALSNFMEVYGSNIDFRDVASRIKSLKA
jgi:tetratricopeptide (TPR) repeat protein